MTSRTNDIRRLLYYFTSDDEYRLNMHSPFVQDGRIVATDAKILISLPESILGDHNYISRDTPRVAAVTPPSEPTATLTVGQIQAALNTNDIGCHDIYADCNECDEEGDVEWTFTDSFGATHTMHSECPLCGGTHMRDNGHARYILYRGSWFYVPYILRLLAAMKLFNAYEVKVAPGQNPFRFDLPDGIMILIAPALIKTTGPEDSSDPTILRHPIE